MTHKKTLILLVLSLVSFPSFAQRTAEGAMALSASFSYPFKSGWGVGVDWNYYTMTGYWDANIDSNSRTFNVTNSEDASVRFLLSPTHITARGGYMARLVATRDRRVSLYAGGGILLGAGIGECDNWDAYNSAMGTSYSRGQVYFLYGVYPKVECEVFFTDMIAFVINFKAPVTLHTKDFKTLQTITGVIYPELCAGVKFNF